MVAGALDFLAAVTLRDFYYSTLLECFIDYEIKILFPACLSFLVNL